MATSDLTLLDTLLQEWRALLILWAKNGTLTRAAQDALQLEGEPEKLRELVAERSEGDFSHLPPVVLLASSASLGSLYNQHRPRRLKNSLANADEHHGISPTFL